MAKMFKRKRLWVDPAFQGRLLARTASYLFLYAVAAFHIAFLFEVLLKSIARGGPAQGVGALYVDYLHQQKTLLLTFFLTAPYFLFNLLRFSHRIAGPLYRCRRVMREMAEGKVVPAFKPRKHDLMTELFEAFNALIKTCNERAGFAAGGGPAQGAEGPARQGPVAPEGDVRIRAEQVAV
jgi:hypothetical protein